jgi:pimeloyl-ACP methyl ester carboxylesterase
VRGLADRDPVSEPPGQPFGGSPVDHGRVIAVDLPGFGRSQPPRDGADAIAMLVQRLDLPHVVFVGHSLGGPLSVRFAVWHPELVSAIVLVAGAVQTFADALSPHRFGQGVRRRAPHPPPVPAARRSTILNPGFDRSRG